MFHAALSNQEFRFRFIFLVVGLLISNANSLSVHVGPMHNVAMAHFETNVENHPPEDLFEYVELVKDEARFLCNGVKLCREQIPTLVEKAVEYAEKAGDYAKHDFRNKTVFRFQNALPNDFVINDTIDYVVKTAENVLDTKGHNVTSVTEFAETMIRRARSMKSDIAEYSAKLPDNCEAKRRCALLLHELDLIIADASVADRGAVYWHPVMHDTQNPLLRHVVGLLEPELEKIYNSGSKKNKKKEYYYYDKKYYHDDYYYEFDTLYEAQKRVKKCLKFKELILAPMIGSVTGFVLPGPPSHNVLTSTVGSFVFSSIWFIVKMKNCAEVPL